MAALLRCVPLPWDCDALYSQITSCSGIAAIMDRLQYARRYQNSSVREFHEPSSVCQCHNIIMSLRDRVLYFTFHWRDGQFGHARPPAVLPVCTAFAASPPLADAYVLRCQTPKTRRTACERRHRRRSTDQAFWRRQTGFDKSHLVLYRRPTVLIVKFIAF